MLTLYHAPKSRSTRFVWLIEELGVPYDLREVSIRRANPDAAPGDTGTIGERDPDNVHPHGKVPAIVHDGVEVWESAAVALYLTDAFPDAGIGPQVGDPKRGAYVSWLAYYPGVFEPAFIASFFGFEAPASAIGWVPVPEVMELIKGTLSDGPFLLGEKFSSVDVLCGGTFAWFMQSSAMPEDQQITDYVERLTSRPAYKRAAEIDGM